MPSALVTGGSSGIGLAIARMLHEEGYALTLAARKLERLEAAAAELGATTVAVDVSARGGLRAARRRRTSRRHGGLDVLVNSAGVGIAGTIGDTQTKQFDLQQSVNLRGAFLVTREALPALREAKGYVVNLASIAGTIPTPGLASYGAAKAALISLTRSLDREEADAGVRVTALCPGLRRHADGRRGRASPASEMIQPEDCAELVRALLRPQPGGARPGGRGRARRRDDV